MTEAAIDLTDVFAYIDEHQDAFLDRLFDYLRRPSISAQGIGIREVAEYIAGVLTRLGVPASLVATDGWPMVFGQRCDAPGAPTVLLYGHYDVQPPDPLDQWISPPFEPAIRDGRIYARGAGDNKGQHFAQILALESLLDCRGALPCNVKALLEGEEEIGSPHVRTFVQQHREELAADLMVVADGPVHDSGQSCIELGVRGVLSFELRAREANRDLHSGNWGGVVPNPLWTLVHLLASMKNAQGAITIEGFYDRVQSLSARERDMLANLPVDVHEVKTSLGLRHLDAPAARGFYERLSAWPTLTINGIHGGYAGPGSKTVLPHTAVAKCDIRLVANQTADDIFARLKKHVRRHAPGVTLVHLGAMDPAKAPADSPYIEPIRRAVLAGRGEDPLLVPAMGGSLPNYAFTQALGVPVFTVPYANPDEANHAPNENLEVERFFDGIKTGAALLAYLGAMSVDTQQSQ